MKLTFLLLALLGTLSAQPERFSTPACASPDQELARRTSFLLCHSSSRKVPLWTGYELLPDHLNGTSPRLSRFRHDSALSSPGASDSDYRGSGYSRGHMVPAKDLAYSDAAMRDTFLLSNAAPQRQSVNAGRWRQLEAAVRQIASQSDAVYVFTGPIFDAPETEFIGPGRVAVPTHFFKVMLVLQRERRTMYAAIVPNAAQVKESLDYFTTTVEEVQRRTGLDFFSALDDEEERQLESSRRLFPGAILGVR